MIRLNKTFLLFLLLVVSWNLSKSQNLFNAENSRKFAGYLFRTQQYDLAAREYERILSINRNDTIAFTNLIKAYRLGNSCQLSFKNLEILNVSNFFKNEALAAEYLKLTLSCNNYNQSGNFFEALSELALHEQKFYQLGRFVFEERTDSVILFTNRNRDLLSENYSAIYSNVQNITNFKRKKPGLAAVMSTIIPGSGKAYVGYWGDAIMSLVFVSTNAWLSYKGFNKKGVKSANGWIFGSISMGFYLGNIWGSGRAAKTYNRIEYENLYNDAKNSYYNHF